jgi:tRNA dimethylallyltransferase
MARIVVVCGPTASGKSQFAYQIAKQFNGVIINADALQVYHQIPIITASPTKEDKQLIQHFLYNHVNVWDEYSVARYISEAAKIIDNLPLNQNAIIVGGSGMYINSLIYGTHKLPYIDNDLRSNIRAQVEQCGITKLYQKLEKVDSIAASTLNPMDSKRIIRAYEVFMQTGNSIYSYYRDENLYYPLEQYNITTFYLCPEREFLYQNCNSRFEQFIKTGAIDEASKLLDIWNNFNVTAKKALGLQEIFNYLQATLSLQEAITIAQQKTRNFAKRQTTWFSNQLKDNHRITFATINQYYEKLDFCLKVLLNVP